MSENRYIGEYPLIGIRPTIDGRRGVLGVRESLEEQTMNMAKSAAKLFTENLKYSNGEPVKVIIADTTIGRVAEAAACADKFRKAGVDITFTVTPCWCYGAETMDMEKDTIKAVYGYIFKTLRTLCEVLSVKYDIGVRTRKAYDGKDTAA